MAEPELKNREYMSKDLKASGFDAAQTRSLLRMMASLKDDMDLPTYDDWKQSEENNRKLHEEAAENNRNMHEEAAKLNRGRYRSTKRLIALIERHRKKRDKEFDQKLQASIKRSDQKFQEMQGAIKRVR